MLAFSRAAVDALAKIQGSNGKVGAVGFCWGGGAVNALAVSGDPNLKAGVAYYGRQAPAAEVPKITAPLLLHYAGLDERINAGIAEFEAALKANGKALSSSCMRAPTTPSTTTPMPRATTRRQPTSPGAARWRSSRNTCLG